jgi:glycine cleavage system H protein
MQSSTVPVTAPPCIWMSAGLISYKLCERELDCEHCPLDAALRGEEGSSWQLEELLAVARRPIEFPADRLYCPGHSWFQRLPEGGARIGLDALAAALVGSPRRVAGAGDGGAVTAGESLCELDLSFGSLPLNAPCSGRGRRLNPALAETPSLLAEAPYDEGWLFELASADGPAEELDAAGIRERARLDLRHFRRRVALALLCDLEEVGPTLADGGQLLTDLRLMVGPRRYLGLVRELVH